MVAFIVHDAKRHFFFCLDLFAPFSPSGLFLYFLLMCLCVLPIGIFAVVVPTFGCLSLQFFRVFLSPLKIFIICIHFRSGFHLR